MSFDVKLFLSSYCCLLCHLIRGPAQSPPVGTKWHLVCRDAKDELDIMSRPGLPLMAQCCAPLGLVSSGQACSETERADLIPPAGQIMRNSGISSGSPSHLHSLRIECEELHCRKGITHL
uniref:PPUP9740 n=1 Tax=Poeciliopsis prolifica TaxID=188132 RepID=A0A0S7IRC5_9TELE